MGGVNLLDVSLSKQGIPSQEGTAIPQMGGDTLPYKLAPVLQYFLRRPVPWVGSFTILLIDEPHRQSPIASASGTHAVQLPEQQAIPQHPEMSTK